MFIVKYKFGNDLFQAIADGNMKELTEEKLRSFMDIYPRESEIKALNTKIFELKVTSYAEALH